MSKLERDLEHMSQTKAHQLAPIVAARRVGPRKTGVPAPGGAEESTVLTEKLEEHMLARGVAENAQLEAESLAELMRVEVVAPSAVFPVPLVVPLQLAMLVTPSAYVVGFPSESGQRPRPGDQPPFYCSAGRGNENDRSHYGHADGRSRAEESFGAHVNQRQEGRCVREYHDQ